MHTKSNINAHNSKIVALALCVLAAFGNIFNTQVAYAGEGNPASAATSVQIIVKFRATGDTHTKNDNPRSISALSMSEVGATQVGEPLSGGAVRAQVDAENVDATLNSLNARADVEFAEIDEVFTPQALTPNDARFNEQVQYQSGDFGVNLPAAWAITTGAPTVTIAVLDTGVRFDHPEFAGRLLAGYDFINNPNNGNDGDSRDSNASDTGDWVSAEESSTVGGAYNGCAVQNSTWHGTAMAGLLGATGNNSDGIAGVNWQSKILPVRVLGKCGGSSSDIADAIRWAAGLTVPGVPDNTTPAQVLNLSLGRPGRCSNTMQSAINDANAMGAIIVVAAGNNGINATGNSPANCAGVITVGASTVEGTRPYYSSYGELVDIAAPGGDIIYGSSDALLSLSNTGSTGPVAASYAPERGTSISTAVVSGIISLMKSVQPSLNTNEVVSLLQQTATNYATADACADALCASGIVNAGAAVQAAYDFKRISYAAQMFMPALFNNAGVGSATAVVGSDEVVAIPNGNFELGNQIWAHQSAQTSNIVIAQSGELPGGIKAYDGNYAAWLGNSNSSDSHIEQTLNVPTSATKLHFFTRIQTTEASCKGDLAYVQINGVTVRRYALCYASQTNDWMQRTVDLSDFAGQHVRLTIRVTTNAANISQMFVDSLQFSAR